MVAAESCLVSGRDFAEQRTDATLPPHATAPASAFTLQGIIRSAYPHSRSEWIFRAVPPQVPAPADAG